MYQNNNKIINLLYFKMKYHFKTYLKTKFIVFLNIHLIYV